MISYMFHIVYGAGAPGALSSQPHPYHHFGWLLHPEAESCQASMLRQHGPGGGGGMPVYNRSALTALVDRWQPETHTFHLPCGEMTVTLEDVAKILGLPIKGFAISGDTRSGG